jgi:hypothetical protein
MTFLRKEVENFGTDELIAFAAKEEGISCEKEIQHFLESELIKQVDKKMIRDRIVTTDEKVLKYYKENPELFRVPDSMEVWVMDVSSKEDANMYIRKVKNGYKFVNLISRYSKNRRLKENNGYLGFITRDRFSDLSRFAFDNRSSNDVIGPVKYRDNLYLLKTGRFIKSHISPFSSLEVKFQARQQYERYQFKKLSEKLLYDLKNKYEVKINEKIYHEI